MVSRNITALRERGPLASDELPNEEVSLKDKQDGVWKFAPSSHTRGRMGGANTPVYYLKGDHDPETVLRKWLDTNPHATQSKSEKGLRDVIRDCGSEFEDACSVLDDYEFDRSGRGHNPNPDKQSRGHYQSLKAASEGGR